MWEEFKRRCRNVTELPRKDLLLAAVCLVVAIVMIVVAY